MNTPVLGATFGVTDIQAAQPRLFRSAYIKSRRSNTLRQNECRLLSRVPAGAGFAILY